MMKCDPEILLARLCVSGDDNDNDGKPLDKVKEND